MTWLLDTIWSRVLRRYFFFQASTIALQAVLNRPYDTTKEQDIEHSLGYAADFIRAAEAKFRKLDGEKNGTS